MRTILVSTSSFELATEQGRHELSVACGTTGIYPMTFILTPEEVRDHLTADPADLSRLVRRVTENPAAYRDRA